MRLRLREENSSCEDLKIAFKPQRVDG